MKKTLKVITISLLLLSCTYKNNDNLDYKINRLKTLFPNHNLYLKNHDEFYLVYEKELYIATIINIDSSITIRKMNNLAIKK